MYGFSHNFKIQILALLFKWHQVKECEYVTFSVHVCCAMNGYFKDVKASFGSWNKMKGKKMRGKKNT